VRGAIDYRSIRIYNKVIGQHDRKDKQMSETQQTPETHTPNPRRAARKARRAARLGRRLERLERRVTRLRARAERIA
jgi:hypothetical protein